MKSDAALHFDCSSGISGDMTLGALVELGSRLEPGFDSEYLRKELRKLPVDGWSLDFCRDERCGITGTRALVKIDGEEPVHDHHHDGHGHHHHDHEHDHEHHDHHAHHDHHEHTHRRWKDIRAMIQDSTLGEGVKARALDIFRRIAEAEGAVHGLPPDEVAFHEVGALDSIIDIAGAAICLDALGPKRITASRIELGGGTVRCAHGVLPVPAPATLALCKGLPVSSGGFDQEMTTPTGAAILASCVDEFVVRGNFTELETACGIGTRKTGRPNVLRVSWRREESPPRESASWRTETLIQLETSVDDMTGEALGFLMEKLFEAGALDVNYIPCTMKKSRPGIIITVLCRPDALTHIRKILVSCSATIGFRESPVERLSLPREESSRESSLGPVRVKTVFVDEKNSRSKIEYEDRARIAKERGISLDEAEKQIAAGISQ